MLRLLLACAALVAACNPATQGAPSIGPTVAPTQAVTAAPAGGATVSVAGSGYFVGPNGMALYTFDNDSPGTSACSGECAATWPALTVAAASDITVGAGLDSSDFATITRTDGPLQVTFNHVPLYYFAGDSAAGDTNGDGVGGVWHLATAQSAPPVQATSPAQAPPPASSEPYNNDPAY